MNDANGSPGNAALPPPAGGQASAGAAPAAGGSAAVAPLLQAAHEGIVVIDADHRIVAFNPAAERMFGCSAAQALGQPLERFLPAESRQRHAELVARFAAAPQDAHRNRPRRLRALRADGSAFPVEISLSPVDMAVGGGVQRLLAALVRDLGEEQQLRDQVERLQLRLDAILELAPIAIWVADGDRIVFANRAAGQLLGRDSGHALVGHQVYELLAPQAREALREQVTRALAGETGLPPLPARIAPPAGAQRAAAGDERELEIAVAALPDHGRTTVQMVVADVTQRRREAAELQRSRQALRGLSASVVDAREQERRRIARELHDELGQRLSALKLGLAGCAGSAGMALDDPRLQGMLAMLDDTVASLRRIAADLRPLMLDDLGLAAAVEWLAEEATRRLGMQVRVEIDELQPEPGERLAIAVYRMVQEALTNAARHAKARHVQVALRCRDGELQLTVQDDGIGFQLPARARPGSYGLLGMRERARLLGGRVEIDNRPGGGGRVRVWLPLDGDPAADTSPGTLA
ncbi:MAG: PAS domain S-box protein [Rubrivivax sp.]|nr:PAS domain S-box protein [Rubrivivax sp.]